LGGGDWQGVAREKSELVFAVKESRRLTCHSPGEELLAALMGLYIPFWMTLQVIDKNTTGRTAGKLKSERQRMPGPRSLAFVSLDQLAVDEDAILLWPEAGQEEFSFLLDGDLMSLLNANDEFVTLGETKREHPKILDGRLAVNADFDIADELVEREINAVLFGNADHEAELHGG
jgi:hypothetical protein